MLNQVLNILDLKTDFHLDVMTTNQTLNMLSSRIFAALDPIFEHVKPELIYSGQQCVQAGMAREKLLVIPSE